MIYTIENEFLRVSAEDDGAQLSSVELKENGKEFLWTGNTATTGANTRCRSTALRATRCLLSKSRAEIP